MKPIRFISAGLAISIVGGCMSNEPHTVPEYGERAASPRIVGDGLEVRIYPLRADRDEVRRALVGLDARLTSSNALILRGLEYYELELDRLDALVDVVSGDGPGNVRWIGQSFTWQNLIPDRVPVESKAAWLALPGRTWSTMMEDGPVVYIEAMPLIGYERSVGSETRVELVREQDLRMESILGPDRCLVLVGGDGLPVVEEATEEVSGGEDLELTLGGALLADTGTGEVSSRDFMVFIPHFTPARLQPLRSRTPRRPEGPPES